MKKSVVKRQSAASKKKAMAKVQVLGGPGKYQGTYATAVLAIRGHNRDNDIFIVTYYDGTKRELFRRNLKFIGPC